VCVCGGGGGSRLLRDYLFPKALFLYMENESYKNPPDDIVKPVMCISFLMGEGGELVELIPRKRFQRVRKHVVNAALIKTHNPSHDEGEM
jgi:hypothetical protein